MNCQGTQRDSIILTGGNECGLLIFEMPALPSGCYRTIPHFDP